MTGPSQSERRVEKLSRWSMVVVTIPLCIIIAAAIHAGEFWIGFAAVGGLVLNIGIALFASPDSRLNWAAFWFR